ncbi:MAG: DUF2975 domain-containing protein [Burkholderiaceae bacterium]|nr:DUF2975 domain-containing protein [Microbacteriaceae bacterium]
MTFLTRPPKAATAATWVALGLLAVFAFVGGITLFPLADSLAGEYPEFTDLKAPLLTLAIGILACAEMVIVTTAILVLYIQHDRIFDRAAARLVDLLIGTIAVATVLTACLLIYIPGPPPLGFLTVAAVLAGITLCLVLRSLRSLLRRTVLMRAELDVVV